MPISDIILPAGKIIVVLSNSTLSIVQNGVALNFGTVQKINNICDKVAVNQSILFDVEKATPFMIISGTTFYLVDEDNIEFYETALP